MHRYFKKLEILVDKAIPYCLLILIVLVFGEVLFFHVVEPYLGIITFVDWIIITIFAVDLVFKYLRVRNIPTFFKKYYLHIIAIIPVSMALRLIEVFIPARALEEVTLLDDMLGTERAQRVETTIQRGAGTGARIKLANRFFRPLARSARFFKAVQFYEHPHHAVRA